MPFTRGLRGFYAFCEAVGADLQPFQKRIARAVFGPEKEVIAVLPRGSVKSTTASLLAVHHCLTEPEPGVYIGAASRDQARVIGAMVRHLSRHPAVRPHVVWRTDALRWARDPQGPPILQVVASDGAKAHGWPKPSRIYADEIWAWSDRSPSLLGAMLTSMLKNPECRFLGLSVSADSLDSPLGRLRARAESAPHVERVGPVLEAKGDGLHWLEWSLPDDVDAEDMAAVAAVNPLRTPEEMAEQRKRVSEVEWLQFHCCRWGVGATRFLPPGAWQACLGDLGDPDEAVWLGIDIGGSRASSVVIGLTADLTIAEVFVANGDEAVLAVTDKVLEIAARRPIAELAFDPWRYQAEALRLEREHGVNCVAFPQSHSRMTAASENLHRVIVEGKLTQPGDPELDRQIAAAVARRTGRGWRIDKLSKNDQVDGVVALAMAAERVEYKPEPFRILAVI